MLTAFALLFVFSASAQQDTVSTQPTLLPNNGQSGISFNVRAGDVGIKIIEVLNVFNVGSIPYTVWYSTDSINGAPNIATTNNWVQHESGTVVSTTNLLETSILLTNSIDIPAGETYGFFLEAGTRYHSNTAADPTLFGDGNLFIYTGANVGYGGGPPNPGFTIRQFCGSLVYELGKEGQNNAAVLAVDSPSVFCAGTQSVVATIGNTGNNQIDSVDINWEVNGVAQPSFTIRNLLDTLTGVGSSDTTFSIGTATFNAGPNTIKVFTSNPNGVADTLNENDTITIVVGSSAPPTGLSAINVTLNSVQFTAAGVSNIVDFQYGLSGFTLGTGTTVSSSTVPVSAGGLTQGTLYDVYVRSDCGSNDTSVWVGPVSFRTAYAVPFFQDFELFPPGTFTDPWPEGWSSTPVQTSIFSFNWQSEDATGNNENNGDTGPLYDHTQFGTPGGDYIYLESSYTGTSPEFISPPIYVDSALLATEFSFWYFMHGATMGNLYVAIDTNGVRDTILTYFGQQQANQTDQWLEGNAYLTGYEGKSVQVVFIGERGTSFTGDIAIDDVRLDPVVQLSAKVDEVIEPSGALCVGSQNPKVVIQNSGVDTISTMEIVMDVNGVFDTVAFNGSLATGDTAQITFPSVAFNSGVLYDIDFYTINPNNGVDLFNLDDTLRIENLVTGFSGVATIDPGAPASATNFQSFTALADRLNNYGVCGSVSINVAAGTYNETFILDNVSGLSAANKLTIDGIDSSLVTLTNDLSAENALIRLKGSDYVTIKNMTLISTLNSTTDHFGVHFTGNARHDSIVNLRVIMGGTSSGSNGIAASGSDLSDNVEATNASFTTVINCSIENAYFGIHFEGNTNGNYDNVGNSFINNRISNIELYAFYLTQQDSILIEGNTVRNLLNAGGDGVYAFDLMNFRIIGNDIIAQDYGMYLINANSSTFANAPAEVINNMIISESDYGLWLSTPILVNIWHNSVYVEGTSEAFRTTGSFSDSLDVRNNIFVALTSEAADISEPDSNVFLRFDNNNYFTGGTDLIIIAGVTYNDLASYQAAQPNFNANSLEGDPQFVSTTDLHIVGNLVNNVGDNFVPVTTDIDGDTRPFPFSTIVDMGADEFDPPACVPPLDVRAFNPGLDSVTIVIDGGIPNYQYEIVTSGSPQGSNTFGSLLTDSGRVGGVLPSTTYDIYVRQICGRGDTSLWVGPYSFNTANGIPYFEDFESFNAGITGNPWPLGWTSTTTTDPNWESEDATTGLNENSTGTGPLVDHTLYPNTGGTYVYMETSTGTVGDSADFVSPPVFVADTLTAFKLSYWYFNFGADIDEMKVFVRSNGIDSLVASYVGQQQTNQAEEWREGAHILNGYAGQSVQVVFRGYNVPCCSGDLAVDDVRMDPILPLNAGVDEILSPGIGGAFCSGSSVPISVVVINNGSDTITSFDVVSNVNGILDTSSFIQTILSGDTAHVNLNPSTFVSGVNSLSAYTINPNNGLDELNEDDTTAIFLNSANPPNNFSAINVTLTTADILAGNFADSLEIEYGLQGFTQGTGINVISDSVPIPISGLTQSSTYDVYMRAICGTSDTSAWVGPFSFNTAYGVPFYQDFEGFNAGIGGDPWPEGWSSSTTVDPNWESEDATTGLNENSTNTGPLLDHTLYPNTGGTYVYMEASGGTTGDSADFVSPPIFLDSSMTTVELSYWYFNHGAGIDRMEVIIDTNGVEEVIATYIGQQQALQTDEWLNESLFLTGYEGAAITVKFRGFNAAGFNDDVAIDDVEIIVPPQFDGKVSEIVRPVTGCALGASELVEVNIANLGTDALTNFDLSYRLDTGSTVTETFTGQLLPGDTLNYVFTTAINLSNIGQYNMTVYIDVTGDTLEANDTLTKSFDNIPIFSGFPYSESFEGGNGGWIAGGINSSWALGSPSNTIIDTASDGSQAWVTNLTGDYNDDEVSYVESPCFDFTTLNTPLIEFDIWWNSESSDDGAVLQSSIDGGATWQKVGSLGDLTNWYTDNSIIGLAPLENSQEGWTGSNSSSNGSGSWITARHSLDGLGGNSGVILRVAFGSNGSGVDEGFAFDSVRITESPLDASMDLLLSPIVSVDSCYSATEDVSVRISNVGGEEIDFATDSAIFDVNVTGAITNSFSFTLNNNSLNSGLPLAINSSLDIVVGTVNLTTGGTYDIEAIVSIGNDSITNNDTLSNTLAINTINGGMISGLDSICIGDTTILTVSNYQGELQWQQLIGATWTDISGETTDQFTANVSTNTDFRVLACGSEPSDTISIVPISLNPPMVVQNNLASVLCDSSGADTLIVAGAMGTETVWYSSATGDNLLSISDTLIYFDAAVASPGVTDTFYVASRTIGGAGGNIAPDATIIGDGTGGGGCRNACGAINDLDFGTCGTQQMWISTADPPSTTPGDDYIEWTFPTPRTFDSLIIHHADPTARFLTGALVQYWDGTNWVNHTSFSNLPQVCVNRVPIGRLTTDRFRITSWQSGTGQGSNLNFREIEIIEVGGCESPRTMVIGQINCLPIGIDQTLGETASLSIYPNPSEGLFTLNINTPQLENFNLTVRDVQGKTVYTKNVNVNGEYRDDLDFTGFAKGIYYLQIQTDTETKVEKLIIQ